MDSCAADGITVSLTSDEALVLLEWLARFNKGENDFSDQAEQRVLWDLEAMLEREVAEVFSADYSRLLAAARDHVRDVE